ncbi:MAG TPA: DUF58 domain-containing protein [Armatimonadaceae bacterium]|nr:DUF58 domain-containing protein [Armatimonadaceae bacterium]
MNRFGGTAGIKSLVITVATAFLFVVAVLLDLQYLYLMAVALAVLPLSSYGLAALFATRFSAVREHAATVPEGRRTPILLEVTSQGGLPQPAVRIADTLPPGLMLVDEAGGPAEGGAAWTASDAATEVGEGSTAVALDVWDGHSGYRNYFVEPLLRGVYRIGPAKLATTDPLGLFTFGASLPVETEMVVHPEPIPVRDLAVGGEGMYGVRERDGKTRRGEGMDFHGVREYRQGDALRRVHWRTTARTGKLAVVEFERAYQQDIVIGLDTALRTDHGYGRENTLEYAVKVAATLTERTLRAGGGVTLITQDERVVVQPRETDPQAARFRLFDALARVRAESPRSLADALQTARLSEGTHYAILTSQGDPRVTAFLTERVKHGDSVRVYFFAPTSFGGPQVMSPAVAGGSLTIVEKEHSPWKEGGKHLEYLLRESY